LKKRLQKKKGGHKEDTGDRISSAVYGSKHAGVNTSQQVTHLEKRGATYDVGGPAQMRWDLRQDKL